MQNNRLVKYVRDWKGDKVGCVVAVKNIFDSTIFIGWSQCHPNDVFNKDKAIEIAVGRALRGSSKMPTKVKCVVNQDDGDYPIISKIDLFKQEIIKMKSRADRYFK